MFIDLYRHEGRVYADTSDENIAAESFDSVEDFDSYMQREIEALRRAADAASERARDEERLAEMLTRAARRLENATIDYAGVEEAA